MSRRINISVLGSYNSTDYENDLAYHLGQHLAELNVNVISGGQKGIMLSLAKGVREAREPDNMKCCVVGILPKAAFDQANEFVDVAIPVGGGHLQNSIIPLAGDLVIAIGGSAGTLTEISFAWQFQKPIALLGECGWAAKLAGSQLDNRREEPLPHFATVAEIVQWILLELELVRI